MVFLKNWPSVNVSIYVGNQIIYNGDDTRLKVICIIKIPLFVFDSNKNQLKAKEDTIFKTKV